MPTYDVIILGLGAMGSAAAYACAQRGWKVLGLEQFSLVHEQGSSHGHSRIIREVYYEHPAYVPLVQESFTRWEVLEQETGQKLLTRCPCANIGPPESPIIQGVQRAAQEHHLPAQTYSRQQLKDRLPQFHLPDEFVAVMEERAGWLRVEACVQTLLDQARQYGAELHQQEHVQSWKSNGTTVELMTDQGTYAAKSLIITAGPWAVHVLHDLQLPLHVMRQVQLWFSAPHENRFHSPTFPIFIVDTSSGSFYGLPADAGPGVKLAQHYGAPELLCPHEIDRTVSPADVAPVHRFMEENLPDLHHSQLAAQDVCIYTLTPDRHFIIDHHPQYGNVALACGFSGHGFKFAPVVGEILADMIETKTSTRPLELFRMDRFL